MTTFLKARLRAAAYPMTVLGVLSLAGCGGGGGESPEQAMDLSQVSLNCVQQPGETCSKVQATVMLYALFPARPITSPARPATASRWQA